jgi:diguanylate cyclase (GGDEF)-like protein/PAS domain S-box-containing protein
MCEFYDVDDRAAIKSAFEAAARSGADIELDARVQRASGEACHVAIRGTAQRDASGKVVSLAGVVQDVTERTLAEAALREQEASYRRLADYATDIVVRVDRKARCRYVSPSVLEVTGFVPDELMGADLSNAIHTEDRDALSRVHAEVLRGQRHSVVTQLRVADCKGEWVWLETHLRAERDPRSGTIVGLIGSARDISDRKALEAELITAREKAENTAAKMYVLATTDELTGLANRRHFLARLEEEIARSQRSAAPLTLVMLDVDFFKRINDAHGHAAGDEVLRAVARVAKQTMRGVDLVGRLGGEEFAVLMPDTPIDSAEIACERLREAIATACIVLPSGIYTYATASLGLAALGGEETGSALLARADGALYSAKDDGRNRLKLAA